MIKDLKHYGLKVTPQRLAVLDALSVFRNHPTTEQIIEYIRKNYPSIGIGTVYKTLETFVEKGIVKRVKTEKDVMRYDIETYNHHHIYCDECSHIENYFDNELDTLLKEYFTKKNIPNLTIKEINLQIVGSFKDHNPNSM